MRNFASLGVLLMILAVMLAGCAGNPLKAAASDGAAGFGVGTAGSGADAVGTGGGGAGSSAGAVGTGVGGATVSPCPGQPPVDGAPCMQAGLSCGWGDDPPGDVCGTQAICVASTSRWSVTLPNATFCTPLQAIGACPTDTTSAPCTMDTTCTKPDGNACRCTNCRPTDPLCGGPNPPMWYCPTPVTTAGCPASPPNFGTACTAEGVECGYFFFECGVPDRVCTHGIWAPGQVLGCPQSSRRVKKDIRYLSADDVSAMAAETLRLRLATYEYKAAR